MSKKSGKSKWRPMFRGATALLPTLSKRLIKKIDSRRAEVNNIHMSLAGCWPDVDESRIRMAACGFLIFADKYERQQVSLDRPRFFRTLLQGFYKGYFNTDDLRKLDGMAFGCAEDITTMHPIGTNAVYNPSYIFEHCYDLGMDNDI